MNRVRAFGRWLGQPLHLLLVLIASTPVTVLVRWMWFEGRNVPRFDQWRSFPLVFAAQDGTLHFTDLFTSFGDQLTVFTNLHTVVFTLLTDWNIWAEMWVNLVFAGAVFMLYLVLFAYTERKAIAWVLVPFSLLVFMLRQDSNWTIAYNSGWWLTQLWWLVALLIFLLNPKSLWAAVFAGIFGFFATISQAVGLVTWPVVAMYLLFRRECSWGQLIIWFVMGVASVGLYALLTPAIVSNSSEGGVAVLGLAAVYALVQVGVVFEAVSTVPFLFAVGAIGFLLLTLNALYLIWRDHEHDAVLLWGSVALYGFVAGYLIGVGRIPEDGFERVFYTWYTTSVLPFWVALVALSTLTIWRVLENQRKGWAGRALMYANIIAAGLMMVMYVPSNQNALNKVLSNQWSSVQESCIMRYIFVQGDIEYCYLQDPESYDYNQLAARRLALYATRQPESILHPGTIDDDPILVETHTPWLNTHIRDYFLDGVDRDRIYNLYPYMPETVAEIPNPPQQAFTDFSEVGVDALLSTFGDLDAFWYIRRIDYETTVPGFWEALRERGYFVLDTRERNNGMLVSRVQYVPDNLENSPRFGDAIRLRAVTDVNATVAACDDINVSSFWTAEDEIPLDYSGSLRLLNADGVKVAQSDAGLGVLGSSQWEVDGLYADERTLTVPCDLPPGDYRLTLGVYYYQAPDEFLATIPTVLDGIEPNTALLREITIR